MVQLAAVPTRMDEDPGTKTKKTRVRWSRQSIPETRISPFVPRVTPLTRSSVFNFKHLTPI